MCRSPFGFRTSVDDVSPPLPCAVAFETAVDDWCVRWLGSPPVETRFRAGHVSLVMGLGLSDGRQVVLKARPWSPRLTGCVLVQRHLWQARFPCPEPLAGPAPLEGNTAATAEVFVAGGEQLSERADSAERFGAVLEWLLRLAPHADELPSFRPSLPWVGWDTMARCCGPRWTTEAQT
jgi:hypothetical protein